MSRTAARARAGRDRPSLYQEITDKIIAELEAGRVPWVQPWGTVAAKASLTMPKNAATQRRYSGINVLILWEAVIEHGFSTQNWLTFRQALRLGGNVRKGEHGTTVVYADRFVPDEERERAERNGDEPNAIPFLKRFTVFNTDQCENLPRELTSAPAPVPDGLILPHAEALIQVPRPEAYYEPINWHRTALHELGHWTGAAQRLDRDLSGSFGSKKYAQRSWSPRSRAPSSVHHSASCQRCPTPTMAPGSRSCARMIAPSFAPPAPHRRRRTTCSRFAPSPTNPSKPSNCPAISSSATDRRCPLDEAPRSRLQARPYSVRGRPLSP